MNNRKQAANENARNENKKVVSSPTRLHLLKSLKLLRHALVVQHEITCIRVLLHVGCEVDDLQQNKEQGRIIQRSVIRQVEINSSSSLGAVKKEVGHVEDECSRKR
ncbi:hypothetical protein ISN45_Aa01g037280 [Arabidopsis thaliana x Arabidopsis arenosa]|uniref:Uncharacterized protein n=1 Tax=Arabidopsis thaliana x Arabidopsis arenosa TaxID=1240361 RepID=A0A8T2CDE1_9BRAS|nr:hypothetical protein ISN45_Aa01g037280 [Arabidopsis thaliana x Arabidopsis arenosa]